MKKMKKVMALLLSLVMVLAMSVVAFADEGGSGLYTITINNQKENTGHTYEAYQIFTGTLAEGVLSNIKWGNGVTEAGQNYFGDAAAKAATLTKTADAEAFAKEIAKYLTNPNTSKEPESPYTISGLTAGYYLVKDADDSLSSEKDSYTSYIMKVVKDVTATPKSDIPDFEKKIKDTNDTTGNVTGWQDSADYDIGDDVPFQLKGTVASNYDKYEKYYYAFHDVEDPGLTFKADTVKVYEDGKEIKSGYTVVTDGNVITDGCTFEVKFADLKQILEVKANSVITVEYESKLNNNAVIGSHGNVNKAKLEFSNNPNDSQGGETGKTPWANVIVFTYRVVVNKTNAQGNSLAGAAFELSKNVNGKWVSVALVNATKNESGEYVIVDKAATKFEWKGLDDGEYQLTEVITPARYNTIDPITFTVTADHDVVWTTKNQDEVLTSLSGKKATGEIIFTANADKSELTTNVVNNKGSELPSTGGMGTTIFYVVGSILVLGAAILLITKKRMSAR